MSSMQEWTWLWIGLGGSLGAIARYGISLGLQKFRFTRSFPLATFLINVTGGLLIGVWMGTFEVSTIQEAWFRSSGPFATGFLGGYTTFSTFSYETIQLIQKKDWMTAALYVISSVSLSLGATLCGYLLMH
jgi:CrcB protein